MKSRSSLNLARPGLEKVEVRTGSQFHRNIEMLVLSGTESGPTSTGRSKLKTTRHARKHSYKRTN